MKLIPTYSLPHLFINDSAALPLAVIYNNELSFHQKEYDLYIKQSEKLNITPEEYIKQSKLKEIKYEETIINGELRRAYGYYSKNGFNCNQYRS